MLRTALTVWFSLAAVLGPVLCCCPKAKAEPTPAKKVHSCCHTPTDEPRPAQPADHCPCPVRTGVVEYTAVERTTVDDAADFLPFASFLIVGEWTVEPAPVCIRPNPDDGPPINGQYLLALYQILRC